MSELTNSQSSQPSTDASTGQGTNSASQSTEQVASTTMTPSQDADYYNKTQQLAAERRQVEEERRALEAERARFQQPNRQPNQGYQNYFENPVPAGYYPPQNQHQSDLFSTPTSPFSYPLQGTQIEPQEYASLVEQFGKEGADAAVRAITKMTAPLQQLVQGALQEVTNTKVGTLIESLNMRGKQTYGDAWDSKRNEVLSLIGKHGIALEQAWYAVNGKSIEQAAMDRAYQAQQVKQAANVSQSNIQPKSVPTTFKTVADAFEAAWQDAQR